MEIQIGNDNYNQNSNLATKGEFKLHLEGGFSLNIDKNSFDLIKSKLSKEIQEQYNILNSKASKLDDIYKIMSKFKLELSKSVGFCNYGFDSTLNTDKQIDDTGDIIIAMLNAFWGNKKQRKEYLSE